MSSINVKECIYKQYGNCLEVSNEKISLIIALEFGIRILSFSFVGGENMFCSAQVKVPIPNMDQEWTFYGGHRLWTSPENMPRTYYPDDQPISFEVMGDIIKLVQPLDHWSNVIKEMEISIIDDDKVKVLHRTINKNPWPIKFAAWAITVMAPGGTEIIPLHGRDTGLLHNRQISLWPYTDMDDKRVAWIKDYIRLDQDPNAEKPFKIGINNENGWAVYINNGNMFIQQYDHLKGEKYPDNNVSFETYTCDFMTELETLSPVKEVEPDHCIEHIEQWRIVKVPERELNDNNSIKAFLKEFGLW